MSGPVVHKTTSKGGVMRTHTCDEGVSLQCSAGRHHFDAFVRPGEQWSDIVISQGGSAIEPDRKPKAVTMQITSDFAELLAEFFQGVSTVRKQVNDQQPKAELDRAHEMLGRAQAEVETLKAEIKAIRAHKRKPKAVV